MTALSADDLTLGRRSSEGNLFPAGSAQLRMGDATLQDVKRLAQDPHLCKLVVYPTAPKSTFDSEGKYQQYPTRYLGDEGAKLLAQSPSLVELQANAADLGDEGVCALAQSRTLTVLDLRDNHRVGEVGRAALAEMRVRRAAQRQAELQTLQSELAEILPAELTEVIHKYNLPALLIYSGHTLATVR